MNYEVLGNLLTESGYDHEKTKFLVDGFHYRFDLCYQGPVDRQSTAHDLPFTVGNKEILWVKLMKEVCLGRVASPFPQVSFKNFIQSPIGLVPKDKGTDTHLIFHLLYDFRDRSRSVNFHTPPECCMVHCDDVDDAVAICLKLHEQGTESVFMLKTDRKSAFCILPLNKSCWKWVVMKATHPRSGVVMYFVKKCLPFRSSVSCAHFQCLSDALKYLAEYRVDCKDFLTNYLDDFLFLARLMSQCNHLMNTFLSLCAKVGFLISVEKMVWTILQIVFLGILLNGNTFTLSIPLEKRICLLNKQD